MGIAQGYSKQNVLDALAIAGSKDKKNLYLTGAGNNPGGSISGMPGRNYARVFLSQQQPLAKVQQSVNS